MGVHVILKPVMHLFNTSILKETITKYKDPAMDDQLDTARLVDPRFKLQYTQEEKREYIKQRAVLELLKGARAAMVREEESREEAIGDASAAGPPAKKTKRSLGSFFSQPGQPLPTQKAECTAGS
ncbi:hypothetical protein AMECASPLE_020801 [Ameca splendens]|uniref:Uncharacterized protein n=1 Tax=Ameca splendens TaxID=208324 RepID=A0ABV0Y3F1_9TELE